MKRNIIKTGVSNGNEMIEISYLRKLSKLEKKMKYNGFRRYHQKWPLSPSEKVNIRKRNLRLYAESANSKWREESFFEIPAAILRRGKPAMQRLWLAGGVIHGAKSYLKARSWPPGWLASAKAGGIRQSAKLLAAAASARGRAKKPGYLKTGKPAAKKTWKPCNEERRKRGNKLFKSKTQRSSISVYSTQWL